MLNCPTMYKKYNKIAASRVSSPAAGTLNGSDCSQMQRRRTRRGRSRTRSRSAARELKQAGSVRIVRLRATSEEGTGQWAMGSGLSDGAPDASARAMQLSHLRTRCARAGNSNASASASASVGCVASSLTLTLTLTNCGASCTSTSTIDDSLALARVARQSRSIQVMMS